MNATQNAVNTPIHLNTPQPNGTTTPDTAKVPLSLLASVEYTTSGKAGAQFDALANTAQSLGLSHFPHDDREAICMQIGLMQVAHRSDKTGVKATGKALWKDIAKACGLDGKAKATLILAATVSAGVGDYLSAIDKAE